MDNRRPGCLSGLFKLFLLNKVFDWMQERFGYKSGSAWDVAAGLY